MSDQDKIELYNRIAETLWNMARYGNPLQSSFAAALIRSLNIPGLDGEDPSDA